MMKKTSAKTALTYPQNLFDLRGKVALVTGASSGLGQQYARVLAAAGANLALVARRRQQMEQLKAKLEQEYHISVFVEPCDVMRTSDIRSSVQKIRAHFGTIDILVNNAGVGVARPSIQHPDEDWLRVINTNLNAVFYFCREVGEIMMQHKYGRIINCGSIHSRVAMPNLGIAAYAASKGGILMLTKALAAEWAPHGITVNALGPSYFKSEMTKTLINNPDFLQILKGLCPMGRIGNAGELDTALLYFASDASSFTTGQLLNIDGGWTTI